MIKSPVWWGRSPLMIIWYGDLCKFCKEEPLHIMMWGYGMKIVVWTLSAQDSRIWMQQVAQTHASGLNVSLLPSWTTIPCTKSLITNNLHDGKSPNWCYGASCGSIGTWVCYGLLWFVCLLMGQHHSQTSNPMIMMVKILVECYLQFHLTVSSQ